MSSGSCWAVVAVKARARCKSRLAPLLDDAGRVRLAREMLGHVLGVVRATQAVDALLVVSPERDTLPAEVALVEDAGDDLNRAFETARHYAIGAGAGPLLLLPADLPSLRCDDLDALIAGGTASGIAIAPDHAGTGTNALYLERPAGFPLAFGPGSRAAHERAARERGLLPSIIVRPGLQADIDTVRDCEAHWSEWHQARAAIPSTAATSQSSWPRTPARWSAC